jgi:hypothetical protein
MTEEFINILKHTITFRVDTFNAIESLSLFKHGADIKGKGELNTIKHFVIIS